MRKLQFNVIAIIFILFLAGCTTTTIQPNNVNEKHDSTPTYTHHHGWGGKNIHHIQKDVPQS